MWPQESKETIKVQALMILFIRRLALFLVAKFGSESMKVFTSWRLLGILFGWHLAIPCWYPWLISAQRVCHLDQGLTQDVARNISPGESACS